MELDQIAIALFGALAAWLSQARSEKLRRWACIFGMLGQPAWFYAAWKANQWGERDLTGRLDAWGLGPLDRATARFWCGHHPDRPPQVRLPPGPAVGNQQELFS